MARTNRDRNDEQSVDKIVCIGLQQSNGKMKIEENIHQLDEGNRALL